MSNVDVISQTQRIVVDNSSTPIDSSKSQRIVVDPVTNTTIVVSEHGRTFTAPIFCQDPVKEGWANANIQSKR
jgi:hypothetical protein